MYRLQIVICLAGAVLVAGLAARSSAAPLKRPAAAAPIAATSDRLPDRRYVAAGTRAYVVGSEDGRFPALGWHTRGEMGGFWSPPLKLLDGLWFGIGNSWIGRARQFVTGPGFVRMLLPTTGGVRVARTEFAPDGRRAVLVGLQLQTTGRTRTVTLKVDAHSELMSAFPWGGTTPSQTSFNLPDSASFDGRRLVFSESGTPDPNSGPHTWAAIVGSSLKPLSGTTGTDFRGPQDPAVICPADGTPPPLCDDTAFGKGAGGELRYRLKLRRNRPQTVWFTVAGSDAGAAAALSEWRNAASRPGLELAAKTAHRLALGARTKVQLPGDRLLQDGIEWSKQNLADAEQSVRDLHIRFTDQGTKYPPVLGVVPKAHFVAAGFPDYPWLFATDGEYTAFAMVGVGQFAAIEDHLRALRNVSRIVNGDSGKVVHETVTDGSVYYGALTDPGNTDETAKFPSAVALVWRWTGDRAFLNNLYAFTVRNMHYVVDQLDADHDGWPEGLGNVERPGMGDEKLDNAVYTLRGLRDLASMAAAEGDSATLAWASTHAQQMETAFESAWWMPSVPAYADSLQDPGNVQVQQRHWIGVTPMEAELVRNGEPVPGIASRSNGTAALGLRETSCYGTSFGLFHTGTPGCDPAVSSVPAEKSIFTVNTAVMAVGEGNYGRLGPAQQQRFADANARLQLRPDEQPGAMPEIAPSPDYGRSIDKAFVDRAMVLQSWGNYGTVWPVVHQLLGVRPDLGNGKLEVTPQVPANEPFVAGSNIRLGSGSVDVRAEHHGSSYVTDVVSRVQAGLTLGHTLPAGAAVAQVQLDGHTAAYRVRDTNRGREVLVVTSAGHHRLVITSG
jgi:hypothetical protein